jgi:sterol desaturase/sphingolipid hydroxylase (fatty acid hydroxylase superfamily)
LATYASILLIAIPFFFILIGIEYAVSIYKKQIVLNSYDTISSLSSGMTNALKDVLELSVVIISYSWLVDKIAILSFDISWWHYVVAFFVLDFAGYWTHRWEHEINVLWNRHIIHHSSEEFNLACALRQNISAIIAWFTFLLIPAALLGVPSKVIAIVAPLHLFAQFWYHTRLIDKMGFLEKIIVTPSHHRVHHAINDIYIDKNYGQIFIFWDKWFGTFQEELISETPVYGVKRAVKTWNPILINFQHLWSLVKDAWNTKAFADKVKIWFMPTGWRPDDVQIRYPLDSIENAYSQKKYKSYVSKNSKMFSWIQFIVTLLLMLYMFSKIAEYRFSDILFFSAFIFLLIYAYTSFMDNSFQALTAIGIAILLSFIGVYLNEGSWIGINGALIIGWGLLSMILYFILLKQDHNQIATQNYI